MTFFIALLPVPHTIVTWACLLLLEHIKLFHASWLWHCYSRCLERSPPSVSHDWFLLTFWLLEKFSRKTPCKALFSPSPSVTLLSGLHFFSFMACSVWIYLFISLFNLSAVYPLKGCCLVLYWILWAWLSTQQRNSMNIHWINEWMSQGTGWPSISEPLSLLWNAQAHKSDLNSPSKIINL